MNFYTNFTINKLVILKKSIDVLAKELKENDKAFNKLCDGLDENPMQNNLQEASLKLTLILEKSDSIYKKLLELQEIFKDLKSELSN